MGKSSQCIKMLELLNTGKIFKISELAVLLETNARNIPEYKKELEEAGYFITSIPGKYGGYKLTKSNLFPVLKLTENEKLSLVEVLQYVNAKQDFMYKADLNKAAGKIFSSFNNENEYIEYPLVDRYKLTMLDSNIKERYDFIKECIKEKKEIAIEYASLKSGKKQHILHPYQLFLYNNSWFFFAWNPEVGDVWYFKLNRIISYKKLDKKFVVWKYFNPNNYLDEHGFKQNEEWHHIELLAKGTRAALLKERVYGKNQTIEKIDNETIKVSFDMQNEATILSFILSNGQDIEVLQPQWIKDKLLEYAKYIKQKYKKDIDE